MCYEIKFLFDTWSVQMLPKAALYLGCLFAKRIRLLTTVFTIILCYMSYVEYWRINLSLINQSTTTQAIRL